MEAVEAAEVVLWRSGRGSVRSWEMSDMTKGGDNGVDRSGKGGCGGGDEEWQGSRDGRVHIFEL